MRLVLAIVFSLVSFLAVAQLPCSEPPCPGDPTPGNPTEPPVPISGIEILLLAGGALGARKLIQRRKKDSA